jgi:hypothetical protein
VTPEEKKAYEESLKKVKEVTTPVVEQRALPDKIPARKDIK